MPLSDAHLCLTAATQEASGAELATKVGSDKGRGREHEADGPTPALGLPEGRLPDRGAQLLEDAVRHSRD
eukprot:2102214-Pyramimonas_sp.AAC.1